MSSPHKTLEDNNNNNNNNNNNKNSINSSKSCSICGSTKTSIQRSNNSNQPNWYINKIIDNTNDAHPTYSYMCSTCYSQKRRNGDMEPRMYPTTRYCIICKTTETKLKKDGSPTWSFHKNGRICYKCKLDLMREKNRIYNREGSCMQEHVWRQEKQTCQMVMTMQTTTDA